MQTIAVFSVDLEDEQHSFRIEAQDFEIGADGDSAWANSPYIKIYELFGDGAEEPYEVQAVTWAGYHMTSDDALAAAASAYVNDRPDYEFFEVCPELIEAKETLPNEIVCTVAGRDIKKYYYHFQREEVFELILATSSCVYYAYYESVLMYMAEDLRLVSDNYFAEEGLRDSVEMILKGEEEEIWSDPSIEYVKEEVRSWEEK